LALATLGQYGSPVTVNATLGKGTFTADLRGRWAEGGTVTLALKEGHLHVAVPAGVAIQGKVENQQGFNSITGLEQSGNQISYTPTQAAPTLTLNISVGTGTVAVERAN